MKARRAIITLAATAALLVPMAGVALDGGAAGAAAVPGMPRAVFAAAYGPGGSGTAKVGWLAPTSDGGSAITGYVVTPYKAGVAQAPIPLASTRTSVVLRPLQNGTSYRFRVAATNAVGTGAVSALSNAIVVGAPGQPVIRSVHKTKQELPGVLQVDLVGGRGTQDILRVDGTCTSSNGGATKTGFKRFTVGHGSHWVYVRGLTIGKTYRCTVTVTNKYGTSIRSKPSAAVKVS